MIVVDDMNDWVGCLGGHPQSKTPNIDRLAERGLLFTNAHVAAPVCNPSRVATLTGRQPGKTGIYDNRAVWHEAYPGIVSLPSHFKAHGYHTRGGGKIYHHMPGFNRPSDWHVYFDQVFDDSYHTSLFEGKNKADYQWPEGFPLNQLPAVRNFSQPPRNPYEFDWGPFDKPDREMGDGRMVEWAADFLTKPLTDQPFFLAAGIYRPHLPWYAPRPYFEKYPEGGITPPELKADDLDDLPPAGVVMSEQRRGDYNLVMESGRYQEVLQAYLASIAYCDALIGRLLDALDAGPAADNTIVVLWSDHGWHLGEKQHLHKFTLWERSTHIPFIIAAPGVTTPGSRSAQPVGLIDLFPTLIELCDLPAVPDLDGVSLVPQLRDPSLPSSRPVLTTYNRGNHSLRSEHWRYIRYADGGEELYDHRTDPNEWTNLANDPESAGVKAKLAPFFPEEDVPPVRVKKKPSRN